LTADGSEAASVEVEERGGSVINHSRALRAIYECVTGAASAMLGGIKMWRTRPKKCAPGAFGALRTRRAA